MNGSSQKLIKKKGALEALIIPLVIAIGIPVVIYVEMLEPTVLSYRSSSLEVRSLGSKIEILKKQYEEKEKKGTTKGRIEKPDVYLLNYLDSAMAKSNVKLKSYQGVGGAGAKGITSSQVRFACNADTFLRFLYISENSLPPLGVSNWRITSIAGGSFSGMRQLEGMATITFVSSGAGQKAAFAKMDKIKSWWRDVFAEVQREAPKPPPPEPVEEEEPEQEPEVNWTLTAQMSDGESDIIVVTNSVTRQRVLTDLKPLGAVINTKDELITINLGEEKVEWKLGDPIEQDKLPGKLKDAILWAKAGVSKVDAAEESNVEEEEKDSDANVTDSNTNTGRSPRPGRTRRNRAE